MEVVNKAPAKINLSLDALFQHHDGQHEWKMVMTSVDLADYVYITLRDDNKITVATDTGFLPEDERNLAYQAAVVLQREYHVKQGATIAIEKHIPVAAGLGGGSTDAAAVLRGLNDLWQLNLSLSQLAQLGLQVDSDVPYCVYSRPALVTGRGEKINILPTLPPFWVILAKPQVSISTPTILQQLDYEQVNNHPDTERLLRGISRHDFQEMIAGMGNVLAPITNTHCNDITRMCMQMRKFGAQIAQMSGSGPTVFGLCEKYSRAQHVFNSMKGFCREVYLVCPTLS